MKQIDKTAKQLVAEMTLEEKCSMLSGSDFWHTRPVERLGIPSVMVSDGPHGLRKQDDKTDLIRPVRELKGFEKVELAPGETKTVSFTLDKRSFAYWNAQMHDWHVITGEYAIQIARHAEEIALSVPVHVTGAALCKRYDADSIIVDLEAKALGVLQTSMKAMMGALGGGENAAISGEMGAAMMRYMPLRSLMSFGCMTLEKLDEIVDELNAQG